ncbi:MAG TPA: GNAT family N-acetyltransferase [Pedobacter sp.]
MEHPLDNPIWHALNTGNSDLATGDDQAKILARDVGVFAGLKQNSIGNLLSLSEKTTSESIVVLFVPSEVSIPNIWEVVVKKPLCQMVYVRNEPPEENGEATALTETHVDAMLELTALTEPGPFLRRTIDFGNYQGIFKDGKLIAMAGQRLKPGAYVEISAVCTRPGYTGRNYAGRLIKNQINHILRNSCIPFLHVLPENHAAFRLYQKLGFEVRKELLCYVLKKI